MDFKNYLYQAAKELDREVEQILHLELQSAKKTDLKLAPLLGSFAKSCQGGKRVRGTLVKLGYEIGSSKFKVQSSKLEDILKIGAALEICHGAVLAHDDIIDQSMLRRDQPSLYEALGGNHYGVSQAITLADYGFFLAFKIIADSSAAGLFSKIMMDTAFGQMLELKKADPLLVMKLKTARYTIAGPLMLGATLAGADDKIIRKLGQFGENLGIAFQIRDDILDGEIKEVDQATKEANIYKNKAVKLIPDMTGGTNRAKNPKLGKILEQLADYLVRRTK